MSRRGILRFVLWSFLGAALGVGSVYLGAFLGVSPLWGFTVIVLGLAFSIARKSRAAGWRVGLGWPPATARSRVKRLHWVSAACWLAAVVLMIAGFSGVVAADILFWPFMIVAILVWMWSRRLWKPPTSP